MPFRMRHIARDLGTAFAVLALYLLVLLAPLHQAAGLQRDLSRLGFESSVSWSVCASLADHGDPSSPLLAKCPAAGIGKSDPLGPTPVPLVAEIERLASPVVYDSASLTHALRAADHPGQPRAPPAHA
ncbi:hypothetical protein [Devosia sp. Leaf64]|uniref:hypothetical protein n=1 Tax=Devosia sp. Leaf64 TaxID=1736229 RepID=UPI0012E263EB|nr:hypothetical protein [Devosia sp. Leaf64]